MSFPQSLRSGIAPRCPAAPFPLADSLDVAVQEKSPREILRELRERARLYMPNPHIFHYHNYDHHIVDALRVAKELCERCRKHGRTVDEYVVEATILLHDALFGSHPQSLNAMNAEHVSSLFSYRLLRQMGAPEDFARHVEIGIQGTHRDVAPTSNEALIVRAADLANVGGEYNTFRLNTEKIHNEALAVSGTPCDFATSVERSVKFLAGYLTMLVRLTPEATDVQGRSLWHIKAMRNLLTLLKETRGRPMRVVADISEDEYKNSDFLTQNTQDGDAIVLVQGHGREASLRLLHERLARIQPKSHGFVLPGTSQGAPLAAQSCDRVLLNNPNDIAQLHEAERLLRKRGVMLIRFDSLSFAEHCLLREHTETGRFRRVTLQADGAQVLVRFAHSSICT